jgi:hypothetical protein
MIPKPSIANICKITNQDIPFPSLHYKKQGNGKGTSEFDAPGSTTLLDVHNYSSVHDIRCYYNHHNIRYYYSQYASMYWLWYVMGAEGVSMS